jgi:hypothetical protein
MSGVVNNKSSRKNVGLKPNPNKNMKTSPPKPKEKQYPERELEIPLLYKTDVRYKKSKTHDVDKYFHLIFSNRFTFEPGEYGIAGETHASLRKLAKHFKNPVKVPEEHDKFAALKYECDKGKEKAWLTLEASKYVQGIDPHFLTRSLHQRYIEELVEQIQRIFPTLLEVTAFSKSNGFHHRKIMKQKSMSLAAAEEGYIYIVLRALAASHSHSLEGPKCRSTTQTCLSVTNEVKRKSAHKEDNSLTLGQVETMQLYKKATGPRSLEDLPRSMSVQNEALTTKHARGYQTVDQDAEVVDSNFINNYYCHPILKNSAMHVKLNDRIMKELLREVSRDHSELLNTPSSQPNVEESLEESAEFALVYLSRLALTLMQRGKHYDPEGIKEAFDKVRGLTGFEHSDTFCRDTEEECPKKLPADPKVQFDFAILRPAPLEEAVTKGLQDVEMHGSRDHSAGKIAPRLVVRHKDTPKGCAAHGQRLYGERSTGDSPEAVPQLMENLKEVVGTGIRLRSSSDDAEPAGQESGEETSDLYDYTTDSEAAWQTDGDQSDLQPDACGSDEHDFYEDEEITESMEAQADKSGANLNDFSGDLGHHTELEEDSMSAEAIQKTECDSSGSLQGEAACEQREKQANRGKQDLDLSENYSQSLLSSTPPLSIPVQVSSPGNSGLGYVDYTNEGATFWADGSFHSMLATHDLDPDCYGATGGFDAACQGNGEALTYEQQLMMQYEEDTERSTTPVSTSKLSTRQQNFNSESQYEEQSPSFTAQYEGTARPAATIMQSFNANVETDSPAFSQQPSSHAFSATAQTPYSSSLHQFAHLHQTGNPPENPSLLHRHVENQSEVTPPPRIQLEPIVIHAAGSRPPWATTVARIDLESAVHREYTDLRRRRATYDATWGLNTSGIDPANMALAGFFRLSKCTQHHC